MLPAIFRFLFSTFFNTAAISSNNYSNSEEGHKNFGAIRNLFSFSVFKIYFSLILKRLSPKRQAKSNYYITNIKLNFIGVIRITTSLDHKNYLAC
jgi:hypothetical protein